MNEPANGPRLLFLDLKKEFTNVIVTHNIVSTSCLSISSRNSTN